MKHIQDVSDVLLQHKLSLWEISHIGISIYCDKQKHTILIKKNYYNMYDNIVKYKNLIFTKDVTLTNITVNDKGYKNGLKIIYLKVTNTININKIMWHTCSSCP